MNLIRKYRNTAAIEKIPIPFLERQLDKIPHNYCNGLIKYNDNTLLQCVNHYFNIIPKKSKCMNIRKQMGASTMNNDCVQCFKDCIQAYRNKQISLR